MQFCVQGELDARSSFKLGLNTEEPEAGTGETGLSPWNRVQ